MRLTTETYEKIKAAEVMVFGENQVRSKPSYTKGYHRQKVVAELKIIKVYNRFQIYCNLFGVHHTLMCRKRNNGMHKSLKAYNDRRSLLIKTLKVKIGTKDPRFKEYTKTGCNKLFIQLEKDYPR